MKRLATLMTNNPGYIKWGNKRLAEKLNLKETTVKRFKKSEEFKKLNNAYRSNIFFV